MDHIYSEEELVWNKELAWGQWKFSCSNEEIDSKVESLPAVPFDISKDCQYWSGLFSTLKKQSVSLDSEVTGKIHDSQDNADTNMECSPILETKEKKQEDKNAAADSSTEDLAICLVDLCNQVAPKLRLNLSCVQEEMKSFTEDMCELREDSLIAVMVNAWSQLSSDASKYCFCIPFTSSNQLCKKLCENILLPCFSKNLPSKIEQLSAILSAEGETVCLHLVAPLLQIKDSPLAQDTLTLEELMSSMVEKHWSVLLRELLSGLGELQKWQIPLLATVVEHAIPSSDEVHLLVQLMSSTGTIFAQSRDFGALLVAVAKSLGENAGGSASQLNLITNNYKGPLKFKVLKILAEVED